MSAEQAWTVLPAWEVDALLEPLHNLPSDEGEEGLGDDDAVVADPAPRRLRPSSFARLAKQHERTRG